MSYETQSTIYSTTTNTGENNPTPPHSKNKSEKKSEKKSTVPQFVPKNWKKMLGFDGTLNPDIEHDMFLKFTAYTVPNAVFVTIRNTDAYNFHGMKPVESFKFLHPGGEIEEKIEHKYGGGSLIQKAIQEVRESIGGLLNAGVSLTSTTNGILLEKPEFYNETERRVFNLTLNLISYDNLDADIYEPIRFFRSYSYPTRVGKSILISFPHVFKIEGGAFRTNQSEETFFALKGMEIKYNDKQPYLKSGYPIQATITLNLMEMGQMFSDTFSEEKVGVRVTYTGTNPNIEEGKREEINAINKMKNNSIPDLTDTQKNEISAINKMRGNHGKIEPTIKSRNTLNDETSSWDRSAEREDKDKTILSLAKRTSVGRLGNTVAGYISDPTTLAPVVTTEILKLVHKNSKYKKLMDRLDIDPRHLLEVKKILRNMR